MDVLRGALQVCDYCEVPWRGQDPSLRNQSKSLSCVKGGGTQGRRDCGFTGVDRYMGKVTIPHRLSAEPPLHKGAFTLHTTNMRLSGAEWVVEKDLAPEGSIGRGRKGVKKNAALLHFLAFAFSDHRFGVPRGEQPLGRGSLPRNSETFFASFFGHKKGRPNGSIPLKTSAPPQGGGKRQPQNKSIHRPSGSKQPLHFIRQLPMLRHHQVRVNGQKRLGFFLGHFQRAGVLHQICHP